MLVIIYSWIIISHLFVCLLFLESIALTQAAGAFNNNRSHKCATTGDTQLKKKTGNFEQGTSSKNKQYNLYSRTATKLKPEHGICRQNGPNVAKYRIGVRMKNFSSKCLGVSYYQRSDDSLPLVAF